MKTTLRWCLRDVRCQAIALRAGPVSRCECKRLWVLKNSLFGPNAQNWGDRRCLGDPRKSLVGLPNAISFCEFRGEEFFNSHAVLNSYSRKMFPISRLK